MSWDRIRAVSQNTVNNQRIVHALLHSLSVNKDIKVPKNHTVFAAAFISYLKKVNTREKIDPWDVIILLTEQPHLAKYILAHQFDKFVTALRQSAKSDSSRELVFVTGYYDSYYATRSTFRALLQTRKNDFIQADKALIKSVFAKYPFLKDKKHLDHVVEKLNSVAFAYYLTEKGIKEVY